MESAAEPSFPGDAPAGKTNITTARGGSAAVQAALLAAQTAPTPDKVTRVGLGLALSLQLARQVEARAGRDAVHSQRFAPAEGAISTGWCCRKLHRGLRPYRKAVRCCKLQAGEPVFLFAAARAASCSCGGVAAARLAAVLIRCRFQRPIDACDLARRGVHCFFCTLVNVGSHLQAGQLGGKGVPRICCQELVQGELAACTAKCKGDSQQ